MLCTFSPCERMYVLEPVNFSLFCALAQKPRRGRILSHCTRSTLVQKYEHRERTFMLAAVPSCAPKRWQCLGAHHQRHTKCKCSADRAKGYGLRVRTGVIATCRPERRSRRAISRLLTWKNRLLDIWIRASTSTSGCWHTAASKARA